MMNGPEKSDLAVVAMKPANNAGHRLRSGWSQGRGPRGTRTNHARDGLRAEVACPRGWNVYGRPQGNGRGSVHGAAAPCQRRCAAGCVPGAQAPCRTGRGWRDMAGLRGGLGGSPPGPARPGPPRHVPGAARAATVHPEAGRATAPAGHCRAGGQDRPARGRHRAQCDLRGRLPRLLVRVPARARPARCVGRLVRWRSGARA